MPPILKDWSLLVVWIVLCIGGVLCAFIGAIVRDVFRWLRDKEDGGDHGEL